jgi:hypothetical protein
VAFLWANLEYGIKGNSRVACLNQQASVTVTEGGLEASMGILRSILFKTTIKKALLDVTEQIETFSTSMHSVSSFGEAVLAYFRYFQFDTKIQAETWEATFANMVMLRALSQMPQSSSNQPSYLIETPQEMATFVSLVTEWVVSKGGSAANIYREFS